MVNNMVQLTRIYTKSGDKGKTSLGNGQRVPKSSMRIEVIGQVDEVNAFLGLCAMEDSVAKDLFKAIQQDLFDLGADLCMPMAETKTLRITPQHCDQLENTIDFYNKDLEDLKSFVLPGGSRLSSYLHITRTIVRRAERCLCALQAEEPINTFALVYLNRLSDLLFVLARYMNNKGVDDVLWVPGSSILNKR